MAQSTTNLGKIHVFPSETLYNQFKNLVADNDLALLKDDGAYIIAANLAQNGYIKFSNGLILQWGYNSNGVVSFPLTFSVLFTSLVTPQVNNGGIGGNCFYFARLTISGFTLVYNGVPVYWIAVGK